MPMHLCAPPPNGRERVAVLLVLVARLGEAVRVELERVGPDLRQPMVHARERDDVRALRQVVTQQLGVAHRPAHRPLHRRHQPNRLVHHQVQRLELLQRLDVERTVAEPVGLVAAALLPLGIGGQVVGHRRRGRRRRVVRGHHQEDHVVDDVLVGELVAVLVLGLAQHGQQVGAVLAAALLDALARSTARGTRGP